MSAGPGFCLQSLWDADPIDVMGAIVDGMVGKRLTYDDLTE